MCIQTSAIYLSVDAYRVDELERVNCEDYHKGSANIPIHSY